MPAVAASVPNAHVQTTSLSTGTDMYHHA